MASPVRGALYGRDSLSWRFNSQSFVLLGGPRAAILQVCDPGVASGVASYSTYRTDPLGRLERTLEAMLVISFGSPQRRAEVLSHLERIHEQVRGTTPDGASYSAMDHDRQFWVLATLTDTVIEVDRRYLGQMRSRDREAYYEESKRLADAFGIPEALVPEDYGSFREYFARRVAALSPTEESRDITATLMTPGCRSCRGSPGCRSTWSGISCRPVAPRVGHARSQLGELATVRAAQVSMRNSVGHISGALAPNPFNARALRPAA
ncbi:MAG: oxygenase MpaB family protein [Microthrixaceae bacterium]